MTRYTTAAAAALFLVASPIGAQIVSPVGDIDPVVPGNQFLANFEGNQRDVNLFGRHPSLPPAAHTTETRFEQVDGELTGKAFGGTPLNDICWRRDGVLINPDDLEAGNKVVGLYLRVGMGTYKNFGATFGGNFENQSWVPGPTTVIGYGPPASTATVYQPFNIPDYRLPQNVPPGEGQPPMPALPFHTTYTIYDNSINNPDFDALIWSLCVEGATTGCYPLDAHEAVNEFTIGGKYGVGCVNSGHSFPMELHVDGTMNPTVPNYTLTFDVDFAPLLQPVYLVMGTNPTNIPFTGLCTNIYAPLDFPPLIAGTTNATGGMMASYTVPWTGLWAGAVSYFQAFCWDTGQIYPIPISASNGVAHQYVEANPLVKSIIEWDKNASTASGGVQHGLGIVTVLN